MTNQLWVVDLGRKAYGEILELQRAAARARIAGDVPQDVLFLVEHNPVITLGRKSKGDENLVVDRAAIAARGVELFEVERGGDVTFHGPGQLVGYPIVDLKRHRQDLHWYLRQVEEILIRALATFEIQAGREPKYTGVWTNGRKIASIGVHARDWVTWHGFALNVSTELSYFDLMVPCGIPQVTMTSVERELLEREDGMCLAPNPALWENVSRVVAAKTADVFGLTPTWMDLSQLDLPESDSSRVF
jgi:lipoate-protein ligase B